VADVLLISADSAHIDHVVALTSASQLTAEVTAEPDAVAQAWLRAVVVVVGIDQLEAVVNAHLPRRPHVVVLGHAQVQDWPRAFHLGADAVVDPPGEPGWLAERVRRAGEELPSGRVVGVVGCRGGAGASVFATALAVAAVRAKVTPYLLDLDPLGCGLNVILGIDDTRGLTWDQVSAGVGRIPALSLQTTVAVVHGVGLLGWDELAGGQVAAGVAGAVVDTARLCTPLTVIDLGRAVTDSQQEALSRCDRVMMIVPADVRSVRAARRMTHRQGLSMCEVVVRGPNPGGIVAQDVGQALGLPVLAAVAADRSLDRRMERGEPPGARARSPLGKAGDGLLREVLA
jgi:secretion/DNA translocation related CpaE-like protein